jgi:Septum formation
VVRSRVLAVVLLVALAGCANAGDLLDDRATDRSPANGPTPTAGPDAGEAAPTEGACRRLKLADIAPPTNEDREVPCAKRHTAVTYYVGEWPARLIRSASGVGDRRLSGYVGRACDRAWRDTVGGDLEAWVTSIVSWAWYKPTPEQFDQGARWFRCDLVAGQSTQRLERLPRRVDGILDGEFDDRYRACWTTKFSDKPNADPGELTSCARRHQQRAIGIVRVGPSKADYPGERAAFDRSNRRCGDLVAKWRGNPRPGDYGLQWPRRSDWRAGERHATCWAVTLR